jgi:ribosomal protein L7Ae-like RNA K-turn-binding protein
VEVAAGAEVRAAVAVAVAVAVASRAMARILASDISEYAIELHYTTIASGMAISVSTASSSSSLPPAKNTKNGQTVFASTMIA